MSDGNDELELDDIDGEGTDEGEEPAGDGQDGEPEKEPKTGDAKRISDLQSQKDQETARANKAEAALAKALNRGEGDAGSPANPEMDALRQELRDASLDAVYAEFKELGAYGIDRVLIEGRTRAEMRESATALVGLIKSVATKERNRVLKDNGITPEPAGSSRTPPKDFASMSDEEFEKFRQTRKGSSLWR